MRKLLLFVLVVGALFLGGLKAAEMYLDLDSQESFAQMREMVAQRQATATAVVVTPTRTFTPTPAPTRAFALGDGYQPMILSSGSFGSTEYPCEVHMGRPRSLGAAFGPVYTGPSEETESRVIIPGTRGQLVSREGEWLELRFRDWTDVAADGSRIGEWLPTSWWVRWSDYMPVDRPEFGPAGILLLDGSCPVQLPAS